MCEDFTGECTECSFNKKMQTAYIMVDEGSDKCFKYDECARDEGKIALNGKCANCSSNCKECGLVDGNFSVEFMFGMNPWTFQENYCTKCEDDKVLYKGACINACP